MAGSLEGPLTKLARAQSQLEKLQAEIYELWPPQKRWPVRTEEHQSGLQYRFYLGDLPAVKDEWLLCAGEILFDLRSALDHLAYQLHVRRYRGKLPSSVESVPMFPIFDKRVTFNQWGQRRIQLLSQRDQRAIRNLQPYVTRHDRFRPVRFWLRKLDQIHNIDKHRKLHLVAAAQTSARRMEFPADVGFHAMPSWGPVQSHSQVETWTFTKPPTQMQDHPGTAIQITLNPDTEWVELPLLLRRGAATVRGVLHRFSNRFPEVEGAFDLRPPNLADGIEFVYYKSRASSDIP